jgi:hypothetical protein
MPKQTKIGPLKSSTKAETAGLPVRQIQKYPIPKTGPYELPVGAEILHVGVEGSTLCLFVLADLDAPLEQRIFHRVMTGRKTHLSAFEHIGSARLHGAVHHLFEQTRAD